MCVYTVVLSCSRELVLGRRLFSPCMDQHERIHMCQGVLGTLLYLFVWCGTFAHTVTHILWRAGVRYLASAYTGRRHALSVQHLTCAFLVKPAWAGRGLLHCAPLAESRQLRETVELHINREVLCAVLAWRVQCVRVYNSATWLSMEECVGVLLKGWSTECGAAVHGLLLGWAGALLAGAQLGLCAGSCPRCERVLAVALC